MILERFFQKNSDLKTANAWRKALETHEVERNSFRVSGDVKKAREFARAVRQQSERPAPQVEIIDELPRVVPVVVYARS